MRALDLGRHGGCDSGTRRLRGPSNPVAVELVLARMTPSARTRSPRPRGPRARARRTPSAIVKAGAAAPPSSRTAAQKPTGRHRKVASACRFRASPIVVSREPMLEVTLRCAVCGQEYVVETWRRLPRICTLSGADVDRYVVGWPAGRVVEVRACQRCGQSMARTAKVSPHGDLVAPTCASRQCG